MHTISAFCANRIGILQALCSQWMRLTSPHQKVGLRYIDIINHRPQLVIIQLMAISKLPVLFDAGSTIRQCRRVCWMDRCYCHYEVGIGAIAKGIAKHYCRDGVIGSQCRSVGSRCRSEYQWWMQQVMGCTLKYPPPMSPTHNTPRKHRLLRELSVGIPVSNIRVYYNYPFSPAPFDYSR